MKIKAGDKVINFSTLEAASRKNSFPDILFIAAGKISTPNGKAKFRIKLLEGNSSVKKWSETVEYTDVDGTAFGNMFEAYLLKKDDISGQFIVEFEVNSGSGYQMLNPVSIDANQVGALVFQVITYDDGAGATGAFGLVVMP